MSVPNRLVEPEVLDGLAADDPRAQRSRRDLRRVHAAMRSVRILERAIAKLPLAAAPRRILELGAGDGTLLLKFARTCRPPWQHVDLTLLDRMDLVSSETREGYRRLGWQVTVLREDILDWAAATHPERHDLCLANLFLHHFDAAPLAQVLKRVASTADAFVACEPRRSHAARLGSRLVVFLGASKVTREDAVTSVVAGFAGHELSAAWSASGADGWSVEEYGALPFTHCFAAIRRSGAELGNRHEN